MAELVTTLAPDVVRPSSGRVLRGFAELAAAILESAPDPAWLVTLRRTAAARFLETGLPGAKDEEWRFTPLAGLAAVPFEPGVQGPAISPAELEPFLLGGTDWPLLVVVDGRAEPALSRIGGLPPGAVFGSIGDAIAIGHPLVEQHLARHATIEGSPLAAVNAALMRDGAFVHVAAAVALDRPLHVLHVTTASARGTIVAPRTLIVLEAGVTGTVVESFVALTGEPPGVAPYFTDACADVVVGEQARLEHIRVQREDPGAYHVGFTAVDQQRDSHYRSFTLALGSRLSRHNLHARLGAAGIETLLYGLYLARGDQLVDNHTAIFHDQPDCRSWELYKGVLAERSRGVFNGKVIVQPEAQKTDAKQTNRNLLLGDHAKVDTKPQLEIFADDVKCTHGATVGKLDEQQRFYLRTRGIAGRVAEVLLITAFVGEVLVEIDHAGIRAALQTLVSRELDALIR